MSSTPMERRFWLEDFYCMKHLNIKCIGDNEVYGSITNLWLINDFVDLLHNPDELPAIDSLHEGITDILSFACTQRAHDSLSPCDGALGAKSHFQSIGIHSKELGSVLSSLMVFNE